MSREFAEFIRYGDCMACFAGDSIGTDSSSESNLPYGMQRTWQPARWVARVGRADYGPPAWAWDSLGTDTFYIGTPTARAPGDTYTNSDTAISPNIGLDLTFSGNVPDFAPEILFRQLNDPSEYAGGDWTSGVSIMARMIYYRRASGMATPRIQSVRGTGVVTTGSNINMNGTAGVLAADIDCGTGAGAPGLKFTGASSGDETGGEVYILGFQWFRHSGGTRLPGFGLMQIGEGGWTTTHHTDTARCTAANRAGFFAATLTPNLFIYYIGSNPATGEADELNAGTYGTYKANVSAMMAANELAAKTAGATPPIRHLLINPHKIDGLTATNQIAKGRALEQLAMEQPATRAYIDLYTLAGDTTDDLADGVHPTTDGAIRLSRLMWQQVCFASDFDRVSRTLRVNRI
jgi:lysophospholipase L1-like esterase